MIAYNCIIVKSLPVKIGSKCTNGKPKLNPTRCIFNTYVIVVMTESMNFLMLVS